MKKKGLSMEGTAKALRAAYPPTHAPRKPTKMVRVGWMIYDEVFWGRKPDPRAIPIYAKRTDVKGGK